MTDDRTLTRGSGNVFADAGVSDADTQLVKAQLVSRIDDIIRERGLSQHEAARILGIAQPDLSNLLRGRFRGYSVERLMRMLTALDCNVSIVVAEKGREDATIPLRAAVSPVVMKADHVAKRHRSEWGRRVMRARMAVGLTQHDLGKAVNERKTTISAWETGRNAPSLDFLLHFYEKYDIDPSYIITGRTDGLSKRLADKIQELKR